MVVIDTSESTALPAGVDVDGDGTVGLAPPGGQTAGSSDPDDSILAAELLKESKVLSHLAHEGKIKIVTAVYDVGTGTIEWGAPAAHQH